jgi:hypothetical protein
MHYVLYKTLLFVIVLYIDSDIQRVIQRHKNRHYINPQTCYKSHKCYITSCFLAGCYVTWLYNTIGWLHDIVLCNMPKYMLCNMPKYITLWYIVNDVL